MNNEEDIIQAACFKWFWNNYPQYRYLLFAVPNGGLRSKQTASTMAATGTVAGVPDLIFVWQGKCIGLECKRPGAGLTGQQPKVHAVWAEYGHPVTIFYSLGQFQELILKIIGN